MLDFSYLGVGKVASKQWLVNRIVIRIFFAAIPNHQPLHTAVSPRLSSLVSRLSSSRPLDTFSIFELDEITYSLHYWTPERRKVLPLQPHSWPPCCRGE